MSKIGLCMMVGEWHEEFNEALQSAEGLYDYLSVVIIQHMGANTDKTREVATKYDAKVSYYWPKWEKPFLDDFSTPRNMSIDQLPDDCDWVFILDSDDKVVDPMLARSIIISQPKDTIVMARVQSLDEYGSFMQYRAFPINSGKYVGRIHNQYIPDHMLNAVYTPELVVQYTNRPFPIRYDRNLAILIDMEKSGELGASEKFYMGEMLYLKAKKEGEPTSQYAHEGAVWFKQALDNPEISDTIRYNCNYFLADHYIEYTIAEGTKGEKVNFQDAIDHVLNLFRMSTFLRDPYYLMGRIQSAAGNFEHAIWWLKHAVEMPEEVVLWHISANIRAHAMEQLAMCFKAIGQEDMGMRYHAQARYLDNNLIGTDLTFDSFKFNIPKK